MWIIRFDSFGVEETQATLDQAITSWNTEDLKVYLRSGYQPEIELEADVVITTANTALAEHLARVFGVDWSEVEHSTLTHPICGECLLQHAADWTCFDAAQAMVADRNF